MNMQVFYIQQMIGIVSGTDVPTFPARGKLPVCRYKARWTNITDSDLYTSKSLRGPMVGV